MFLEADLMCLFNVNINVFTQKGCCLKLFKKLCFNFTRRIVLASANGNGTDKTEKRKYRTFFLPFYNKIIFSGRL